MKRILFWLLVAAPFFLVGCEDDPVDYGWGAFQVDLTTCEVVDEQASFVTDRGVRLVPVNPIPALSSYTGKRFLLNYIPAKDTINGQCQITVNSLSRINSQPAKYYSPEEVTKMADHPVQLISAWYAGGYVNFRLKIEINQTLHSLNLVATDAPDEYPDGTLYLELRHNNGGDSPGYYVGTYESYSVKHLITDDTRQIVLSIHSENYGTKRIHIELPQ